MSTRQTRTYVSILIFILAVLIIAGSCATRKKVISPEDAAVIRSGKWINETHIKEEMVIFYPDGRYEIYYTTPVEKLLESGTSQIYESWRDPEGVLWYRAHYQNNIKNEGYIFGKISNSDNTLELIFTRDDLMIEEWKIGKVGYNYVTYYRQE
jgi:hypothetical protein